MKLYLNYISHSFFYKSQNYENELSEAFQSHYTIMKQPHENYVKNANLYALKMVLFSK